MDVDRITLLPGELRNLIWSLALSDGIQDDLPVNLTDPEPPITRTCRLIRNDSLPLYYGRPYGFYTPIAPDDEAARPDKFEGIFEKWLSTRGRISAEDSTERLKCVRAVYVSYIEREKRTMRGWPHRTHPWKTRWLGAPKLVQLFPMTYSDAHDVIKGDDVMTTYVLYRTGTPGDDLQLKYCYLSNVAKHGQRKALELEEALDEEEDEVAESS